MKKHKKKNKYTCRVKYGICILNPGERLAVATAKDGEPIECEECGCKMASIPPPEWLKATAPRILCGKCAAIAQAEGGAQ